MLENQFTRMFGLSAPLMQAPIGSAAGPELVAAVCGAGALGALPVWWMPLATVAETVRRTCTLTPRPFAVNIRADLPQSDYVRAAIDSGARVIHLFWGTRISSLRSHASQVCGWRSRCPMPMM
jgi:NAD(P)H-dependent flavin oxidoreductase YrpB (nitropropane dioxygenase family)